MTTEKQSHNSASHFRFPYWFANAGTEGDNGVAGINFRNIWHWSKDLLIYYGDLNNEDSGAFLEGWCSRWDVQNYSIIVETWLKKEDAAILRNSITPGAVKELFKVLGKPHFVDSTWTGKNSLKLVPNKFTKKALEEDPEGDNRSNLYNMRSPITVYPKNLTEHIIKGPDDGWVEIKLECFVSGNSL